MRGTITAINRARGMYAVALDDGSFTVFELLDSHELEIGDIVSGNLQSMGGETLINETQSREVFEVSVQNCGCTKESLASQLRWRAN